MTDETIVAVYDTVRARRTCCERPGNGRRSSRVPSVSIRLADRRPDATSTAAPVREEGFWASLFGAEPEYPHDSAVYDRSLKDGSTVVTVKAPEQYLTQVMDILERHNPVDIDERAATYGVSQTTTTRATGAPLATGTDAGRPRTTKLLSSRRSRSSLASARSIAAPHAFAAMLSRPRSRSRCLCVTRRSRSSAVLPLTTARSPTPTLPRRWSK